LKESIMKLALRLAFCAFALALSAPAAAVLNVFATVPEWGALVSELGGDKVNVYVATNALQDPHHVEAKPSLIARARTADLVVATGAELEIGWLPLVTQQAGNPGIQPGKPGYFEAARYVTLLEKPTRLDRAEGDVHPGGNPHIQTDPRNIAKVAAPLAARLAELDAPNAGYYKSRHQAFAEKWAAAIAKWEQSAAPLKGAPIVVQHKAFTYLEDWLGLKEIAALEPKPGVEPTTAHLSEVVALLQQQPAKMVLRAAYQSGRASEWIAERTKINVVVLPFTVGGDQQAKDLYGLYDDTIARLLKGAAQ
jgi:zinc/manganese transport system substrate-binding protein